MIRHAVANKYKQTFKYNKGNNKKSNYEWSNINRIE